MASNIYDTNLKMSNNTNYPRTGIKDNLYTNPFSTVKKEIDECEEMDTLDRIELLEYSQEFKFTKDKLKEKDSISISNDSNFFSNNHNEMNIKDYDNFILKIEDLSILDEKVLNQLKQNLIYIECRVPLFKSDDMNNDINTPLFYDTFKYIRLI